jgi:hypothetical protein
MGLGSWSPQGAERMRIRADAGESGAAAMAPFDFPPGDFFLSPAASAHLVTTRVIFTFARAGNLELELRVTRKDRDSSRARRGASSEKRRTRGNDKMADRWIFTRGAAKSAARKIRTAGACDGVIHRWSHYTTPRRRKTGARILSPTPPLRAVTPSCILPHENNRGEKRKRSTAKERNPAARNSFPPPFFDTGEDTGGGD